MKKLLALIILFISCQLNAQECDCGIKTIKTNWPKAAEENNIYGIVKIKYKMNDSCIIGEPLLVQSLGYGCDEEAMRIFSQASRYWNECKRKCGTCNCKAEEIIYSVHFTSPEIKALANKIIYGIKCFLIRFRVS